ncbi:hypothetical protein [Sphingobium sp. YBL2]|uniref:hypothetical protein n=1 Tax=Sphingobium sp. (strain YBL2) TaxID=484429 RepID=UPI0005CC5DCE|nr:hypothetical protein [Sphingobium sp. YBL2]AJR24577.1 hypothetical protein TZ53_13445 [Sphingobium sp. YBL2]
MSASASSPTRTRGWSAKALVITSAAASAFGASLLSVGGAAALWNYQTHRTERATEVTKFIEVSQEFDRDVTAFMTLYLKGRDATSERLALHKNIQDQFLALERAGTSLGGSALQEAELHQKRLVKVGEELDREVPAAKARDLMQAIADARDSGICVTYRLRDRVGMDTTAEDQEYCSQPR